MSELIGWLVVIGLAVAIAAIFKLSSQLELHMRNATEMMLRSNEMLLERLDQLAPPSCQSSEPTFGVVLEKRRAQRREPVAHLSPNPGETRQGDLPRQRLDDLLST